MASLEAREKMQTSPASHFKSDAGFSFVEILIALVIITMAFSVTARTVVTLIEAQTVVYSQYQGVKTLRETTAAYLSQPALDFNERMAANELEPELLPRTDALAEDLYQGWKVFKFDSAERRGYYVELAIGQPDL